MATRPYDVSDVEGDINVSGVFQLGMMMTTFTLMTSIVP